MVFFSKVYIKKGHKIFKIQDFKNSNFLDIHSGLFDIDISVILFRFILQRNVL